MKKQPLKKLKRPWGPKDLARLSRCLPKVIAYLAQRED